MVPTVCCSHTDEVSVIHMGGLRENFREQVILKEGDERDHEDIECVRERERISSAPEFPVLALVLIMAACVLLPLWVLMELSAMTL